eukprot:570924-Hanusia_phi.AAC.1
MHGFGEWERMLGRQARGVRAGRREHGEGGRIEKRKTAGERGRGKRERNAGEGGARRTENGTESRRSEE